MIDSIIEWIMNGGATGLERLLLVGLIAVVIHAVRIQKRQTELLERLLDDALRRQARLERRLEELLGIRREDEP